MKITIEIPDWTEIISVTAIGSPFPTLNASVSAFAVKDGDTVKVPDAGDGCSYPADTGIRPGN